MHLGESTVANLDCEVAARDNIRDDCAHGRFNIGRDLTLALEKAAKSLREVGSAGVEADGHIKFLISTAGECATTSVCSNGSAVSGLSSYNNSNVGLSD